MIVAPVRSPEKKIESRKIAEKSAIVAPAITELAELQGDLTGVLEHRDDHPERGRREDDRDQRGLDQVARLGRETHGDH